jgi:uncharacterized protein (TIGR00369 family)
MLSRSRAENLSRFPRGTVIAVSEAEKPPTPELSSMFEDMSSQQSTPHQQRTLPSAKADRQISTQRGHEQSGVAVVAPPPQPPQLVTLQSDHAQAAAAVMAEITGAQRAAQSFRSPPPALQALGGEILDWSPPRLVRSRFPAHEGWANGYGMLAPGFVAAMFEQIVSVIANAQDSTRQHAILETSTRFFRSIRKGHVIVDAMVLRNGRTTATIETVAWDDSSELCAKGITTVMFLG